MRFTTKLSVVIIIVLIVISSSVTPTYGQTPQPNNAQDAINDAYNAILNAYNSGAETNQLITQLNQAINLTSQAQQLSPTNPQQAETLNTQAQSIAQNVTQQATVIQQSSSIMVPIVAAGTAAGLIVAGVLIYFFGPRALWRLWFNFRKNYRFKVKNSTNGKKSLVITAEQLCALVLGVTIIVAFFSVSGFLLPKQQGEQFSELGVLGPNMKLGDYPSQIVASETVNLFGYVGNQMGQPMYYTVLMKLGENNSQVNPSSSTPIKQYSQIVQSNGTWTFPVSLTIAKVGDNQRIIFELWIYNASVSQTQYHERWGQVWLNVTAPAS